MWKRRANFVNSHNASVPMNVVAALGVKDNAPHVGALREAQVRPPIEAILAAAPCHAGSAHRAWSRCLCHKERKLHFREAPFLARLPPDEVSLTLDDAAPVEACRTSLPSENVL